MILTRATLQVCHLVGEAGEGMQRLMGGDTALLQRNPAVDPGGSHTRALDRGAGT